MMQITNLTANESYFLWAPLALIGLDLDPQKNILLEIQDNRIKSRQTVSLNHLPASIASHHNFFRLDHGNTLLPSLIDAHVHLALDGEASRQSQALFEDQGMMLTRLEEDCNTYLRAGIGYIRDGGDSREINMKVKNRLDGHSLLGPQVITTGSALRRENAYGSFLGRGYASTREIPSIIKRLWSDGVDQIKVIVSGVVSFNDYGHVGGPLISPEELEAIVIHAHQYNLKVMAHASSAIAVDLAVRADVDSIEHGYFVHRENLQLMAERQVAWVPTIVPVAIQVRKPLLEERTIQEIEVITRTYEEQVGKLELAYKLGVPLGVGTDAGAAGLRHGLNLVEELLLYRESTLGNQSILKAVTSVNAGILGLGKDYGSIEVGCKANLIAVQGNPLEELTALKEVTRHLLTV